MGIGELDREAHVPEVSGAAAAPRTLAEALLMAGYIALAGVFEGTGGSPYLARITVAGVLVQLPLAYGLSGLGLPGVCLAMALAMAAQCAALGLLRRRVHGAGQREPDRAFARSE